MKLAKIRLMLVGIPNSPHLHRWTRMVARPDTAILIVPSIAINQPPPDDFNSLALQDVTSGLQPGIHMVRVGDTLADAHWTDWLQPYRPLTHHFVQVSSLLHPRRLAEAIHAFRPHLLHAHETQLAGYVCLEVARRLGGSFPPWIMSNWGSDTALYHKLPRHRRRLQAVLRRAQLYLPDCRRDYATARRLGYRGPILPVLPSSGGMDLSELPLAAAVQPSRRRTLLIKGYHNWAGRALLALSAVTLARQQLAGVRIRIAAASPMVANVVERMAWETGLDIQVLPYLGSHQAALARVAEARAVIGISLSDGLPTTALEAMAVGALPIQSNTACVDEWFQNGRTGLIVSPHDTRQMAAALIRAMTDDAFVDAAAIANRETIWQRWNIAGNAQRVWDIYTSMLAAGG